MWVDSDDNINTQSANVGDYSAASTSSLIFDLAADSAGAGGVESKPVLSEAKEWEIAERIAVSEMSDDAGGYARKKYGAYGKYSKYIDVIDQVVLDR